MEHLSPAIRWGRENEAKAGKCYLEGSQADGEDMVAGLQPTGLHLLPEKSFLGASSDGKICNSVDTCCYGCLEIKYPYSIKGLLLLNSLPMK